MKLGRMADARTYVARCLSTILRNDLDSGAEYLCDNLDTEASQLRAEKAARWWLKRLDAFVNRAGTDAKGGADGA